MKGFFIEITNNLLDLKHRKAMGTAVWEFMWCLDKITKIDEEGIGWVYGGKPINLKDIKLEIGISEPKISKNLHKLANKNYIKLKNTPYGIIITVMKAKKRFNQKVKPTLTLKENLDNLKGKPNKTIQLDKTIRQSEQSSSITIIRKYFTEQCKELKGFEPEMQFDKEGKLLKEKIKRYTVGQLKDLIDRFFNSRVGEDLGYTLSICLSAGVINQWLAGKLERPKKAYFQGNPMRKVFNKWQVLENGEWLEFNDKESKIEWK